VEGTRLTVKSCLKLCTYMKTFMIELLTFRLRGLGGVCKIENWYPNGWKLNGHVQGEDSNYKRALEYTSFRSNNVLTGWIEGTVRLCLYVTT
jgi:hypothetical protein